MKIKALNLYRGIMKKWRPSTGPRRIELGGFSGIFAF
jgi:hypothetical protein